MSSNAARREPTGDPRSPELQEASWLSLVLAGRLREVFDAGAATLDLSHTAVKVLLNLDPERPVAMRSLAETLRYNPSNLTSVVDKLELRGLVSREQDPDDRRVKALVLTPDGVRTRNEFWGELGARPGPLGTLNPAELRLFLEVVRAALARS